MDFPSNSQNLVAKPTTTKKAQRKEKKVEKVVSGDVIKRPASIGKKFKGLFFGGEFKTASHYIVFDVLVPAIQNMAVDATTKGIQRFVYGDTTPRNQFNNHNSRVSYNGISNRTFGRDPRERTAMLPDQPPYSRRGSGLALPEIALVSRGEAQKVIDGLMEILDIYEVASVADYYDLLGLPNAPTDNDWGWPRFAFAEIRQTRQGYVIDLPNPEPLT